MEAEGPRSSCQQVWFLLRLLSLACRWPLSHCPHMVFPLCTRIPGVSLYVQISSPYEDTSQIGLGPVLKSLRSPFNLSPL